MGIVAPNNTAAAKQPFSTFVLAAAHDAGMNTMDGIRIVTGGTVLPIFLAGLSVLLPIPGIASLLHSKASNIMVDLAMTQKDSFTSMLDNGVRWGYSLDMRFALLTLVATGTSTSGLRIYFQVSETWSQATTTRQ